MTPMTLDRRPPLTASTFRRSRASKVAWSPSACAAYVRVCVCGWWRMDGDQSRGRLGTLVVTGTMCLRYRSTKGAFGTMFLWSDRTYLQAHDEGPGFHVGPCAAALPAPSMRGLLLPQGLHVQVALGFRRRRRHTTEGVPRPAGVICVKACVCIIRVWGRQTSERCHNWSKPWADRDPSRFQWFGRRTRPIRGHSSRPPSVEDVTQCPVCAATAAFDRIEALRAPTSFAANR